MRHPTDDLERLRYPVGRYDPAPSLSAAERARLVAGPAGITRATSAWSGSRRLSVGSG